MRVRGITIDQLPMEMIVEIFRYLSFSDLQCAALTCRRWLEASKSKEFMEKMIVRLTKRSARGEYLPARLFLNSKRSFPNVFLSQDASNIPMKFFKHMGKAAVALTFDENSLCYKEFLAVLKNLCHLKTLKILGSYSPFVDGQFLASPTDRNAIAKTMRKIRKLSIINSTISDVDLLYLASLMPELESLDLRGYTIIPNTKDILISVAIEQLLAKQPRRSNLTFKSICGIIATHQATLHKLKFSATCFDEDTLSAMCQLKLQTLFLLSIYSIDTIAFSGFLQTQSNLRHLNLSSSFFVTDDCVETIVETSKSLEILNLEDCLGITNSGMLAIAKLRRLRSLNISRCHRITSEGIIDSIARVTNRVLQQLFMSELELSEECVKLCALHSPDLRVLDLSNCDRGVTDRSVQAIIQNVKWLRELRLDECFKITDAALTELNGGASIQQLKGLRSLNLRGCKQISDIPFKSSFKFNELCHLNLSKCGKISVIGIEAFANNCPAIEELDLSNCTKINDKSIKVISKQLRRLKTLRLNGCKQLTSKSLNSIQANCKVLQTLSVLNCSLAVKNMVITLGETCSILRVIR